MGNPLDSNLLLLEDLAHRHQTKLKHPTEIGVKESFVNNRPVQGKRKHFGSRELVEMRIHKDDRVLIKIIQRRKPIKIK